MHSYPRGYRLPSPYFPHDIVTRLGSAGSTTTYSATAWPAANRAIYVPFWLPASATVTGLSFLTGAAAGNYDVGLYNQNFALLEAKGSTAVAAGLNEFTFTRPHRLRAGVLHYFALVCSSTSATPFKNCSAVVHAITSGSAQEALGSTALPSTATPATMASAYVPMFALVIT